MHESNIVKDFELLMIPSNNANTIVYDNRLMLTDTMGETVGHDVHEILIDDSQTAINSYPLHLKFNVILFCMRGSINFRCNITDFCLTENNIGFFPKGTVGECRELSKDLKLTVVAFSDQALVENSEFETNILFKKRIDDAIVLTIRNEHLRQLLSVYKLMRDVVMDESLSAKDTFLKSHIDTMSHYFASYLRDEDSAAAQARSYGTIVFENFLELVRKNFKRERKVDFYADKLCITPK